jgi:hypothetical protein
MISERIDSLNLLLLRSLLSAHAKIDEYCERHGLLVPYDPELHYRIQQTLDLLSEINGTPDESKHRDDFGLPDGEVTAPAARFCKVCG